MSEGRTPNHTLTEQRQLQPGDIDLLHQIILRAQNDPESDSAPKDALIRSYHEVFDEQRFDARQDKACFSVLLSLLNPQLPGETLYARFETLLRQQGIELSFEDDPSTQIDNASTRDEGATPFIHEFETRTGIDAGSVTRASAHARQYNPSRRRSMSLTGTDYRGFEQTRPKDTENLDDLLDTPPAHITQLMRVAEARDRMTLMRQTIELMHSRRLAEMEDRADAYYERRLLMRTLWHMMHQYRPLREARSQANDIWEVGTKKRAVQKLLDIYRIRQISAMNDERLKGLALYRLTVAGRESTFRRQREVKMKRRVVAQLIHAFHKSRNQAHLLEGLLNHHQASKELQVLRPAVTFLSDKTRQIKFMDDIADEHYAKGLVKNSIQKWWTKDHVVEQNKVAADAAREYLLMKRFVNKLHKNVQNRKARRTVIARWVLGRWRGFLAKRKHEQYDKSYKLVRRSVKVGLAQNAVKVWLNKVSEIKAMEELADERYRQNLLKRVAHPAVIIVYEVSMQAIDNEALAASHMDELGKRRGLRALGGRKDKIEQMENVADRFQTLRMQEKASQCLKQIQMKAFELNRRNEDAEAFRTRQDRSALRGMLDSMRRMLAQRRGEPLLALPPSTPSRRRAEEMSRLSTTPLYTPAIGSFSARLRAEGPARETVRILEEVGEDEE